MAELTNPERRMLRTLQSDNKNWTLDEVLVACDWDDQAIAVAAGHGLSNHGLLKTYETSNKDVILGSEGEKAVVDGLLEARLWEYIQSSPEATMKDLSSQFERHEAGPGVGLLKGLGVSIQGGKFTTDNPTSVSDKIAERTEYIQSPSIDHELFEHFKGRKNLVEVVELVSRTWTVTKKGSSVSPEDLDEVIKIAEITPELLQSDDWKEAQFRPYDVSLEASMPRSGRSHPMQALIERIRSIFL